MPIFNHRVIVGLYPGGIMNLPLKQTYGELINTLLVEVSASVKFC